jgi:hypothetical protein
MLEMSGSGDGSEPDIFAGLFDGTSEMGAVGENRKDNGQ